MYIRERGPTFWASNAWRTVDPKELFVMSQKNTNDSCKQDVCDMQQTSHMYIRERGPTFRVSDAWHTVDPKELFAMSQNNRPGFVGPEPSTNFDLVSRHIADYNAISTCKSVHTYQTNMCSHLARGYKNYPLENYFTVPLLITHKTGLSCQVIPP